MLCDCCGPNVAQARLDRRVEPSVPVDELMVVCVNPRCRRAQRFDCAMSFCDRAFSEIPKYIQRSDPWLREMMPFYLRRERPEGNINIPNCISCCLSATIPEGIKPSPSLRLPHPDPIPGCNINNTSNFCNPVGEQFLGFEDEDDEESVSIASSQYSVGTMPQLRDVADDSSLSDDDIFFVDNDEDINIQPPLPPSLVPSSRKRKINNAATTLRQLPTQTPDSMDYLSAFSTTTFKSPNYDNVTKRYVKQHNKSNKNNTRNVISHEFVGALVLPTHKLILCNYAHNEQLYVDIHGMAESEADGTPTIPHLVLTEANALALEEEYSRTNCQPKYLKDETKWTRHRVDNVELPEDSQKTRAWTIDYATISQKVEVAQVKKQNGRTVIPPRELIEYEVYSYKYTNKRKYADFILIDGDFCMENGTHLKTNLRKLLTMRMHTMINYSISDEAVKSMYTNLRAISGRRGSEVTRTSGTGGYVTHQSHKDLLFVLHENDGLLPNKAGACLIVPHKKYYYILYSKHDPDTNEHPIGLTKYAPPKPGGSLIINGNAVDAWPVLGEFAYLKMVATLTLVRLNEIWHEQQRSPLAVGPIAGELDNIEYSREIYELTGSYRSFVKAFMSVNSMSLIAWPVGQHNDHFNKGGESLENKITFTLPRGPKGDVGRGGSLFHDQFVFALLDWQWQERSARQFYVTHADDMGIGPAQPRDAEQHLTNFFENGDTNGEYRRVYNRFLRTVRQERRARQQLRSLQRRQRELDQELAQQRTQQSRRGRRQQGRRQRGQRQRGRGVGRAIPRPIRQTRRRRSNR